MYRSNSYNEDFSMEMRNPEFAKQYLSERKRCMSPTPEPDGRASPPIFADFAVAPSA